jgi:hypothetical protein
LYGAFVWARRALKHQKRLFLARAGDAAPDVRAAFDGLLGGPPASPQELQLHAMPPALAEVSGTGVQGVLPP